MKAKSSKIKKHKKRGGSFHVRKTPPSISQMSLLYSLLDRSNLSEKDKARIEKDSKEYSMGEAEECINMLEENQVCRIEGGYNYTQGDIQKKLSQINGRTTK